ncbi:MAG: ATP-binding protein [Gemmatimonadales bacterium]
MGTALASHAFRVIYLTGAPAAGKSSVTRGLASLVSPLEGFEYGERLTRYVAARQDQALTQESLRERSAAVVGPEDIQAVDRLLLDFVAEARVRAHVVIDSHPVTRERYGFRVTPFSLEGFGHLSPDAVCLLFTPPEVALERIDRSPGGRPRVTLWESGFHTGLQASVAATYGMSVGVPIYLIDSSPPIYDVVAEVARLFQKPGAKG